MAVGKYRFLVQTSGIFTVSANTACIKLVKFNTINTTAIEYYSWFGKGIMLTSVLLNNAEFTLVV